MQISIQTDYENKRVDGIGNFSFHLRKLVSEKHFHVLHETDQIQADQNNQFLWLYLHHQFNVFSYLYKHLYLLKKFLFSFDLAFWNENF